MALRRSLSFTNAFTVAYDEWLAALAQYLNVQIRELIFFLIYTGNIELALKIAVRLRNYDDILDSLQIYSIIATCAICCRAFETASKAFTELEALPIVSDGFFY